MQDDKRRNIDLLIEYFWKNGYMTLSRRFGTYLPEPKRIGEFDIDIVARYKKEYAIGIYLNEEDLESASLNDKLAFLATRQTKSTNKKVLLFVGVPEFLRNKAKYTIDALDQEIRKNIRLFPIIDKALPNTSNLKRMNYFS